MLPYDTLTIHLLCRISHFEQGSTGPRLTTYTMGNLRVLRRVLLDSIHASCHQVLVWEGNNKGFNHFVWLDIRHLYLLDIAMEESIDVLICKPPFL
jgi:hypothetical protein